jgi:hypothetical protein
MLNTIGNWITTIPLADPWHSIVLVVEVLMFAVILHFLWELGFSLAGKFKPAKSQRLRRIRSTSPQKLTELAVDTAGQDELNPKI